MQTQHQKVKMLSMTIKSNIRQQSYSEKDNYHKNNI